MELTTLLERMKLEHLAAQLDGICEHAAHSDVDFKGFLAQALEAEWRGRYQKSVESRLKQARFPLGENAGAIRLRLPAVHRPQGDAGTRRPQFRRTRAERRAAGAAWRRQTHLAIGVASRPSRRATRSLFLTFETLMTRLVRARHENRLDRTLQQLTYPKLVILDELGYLPLSRERPACSSACWSVATSGARWSSPATRASPTGRGLQ